MSYSYVHTTGVVVKRGMEKQLLRPYVKNYLYSIINAFGSEQFGYDNMLTCSNNVKDYHDNLYEDEKLFIDSGGYSIIVGDVPPKQVRLFTQVYNYFLEQYSHLTDYLFSLDIPIFLKYPKYNTVEYILKCNYEWSQIESKIILDKHPELYEKFIYVWQFKMPQQFKIWQKCYNEIFANEKRLKHFAIGGLVGLRGLTNIPFSPFIAPAYKILRILQEKNIPEESILHILGVYGLHDRFTMMFMDELFNRIHLKNNKCSVKITFDTINYTLSGLYKVRELPFLNCPIVKPGSNDLFESEDINNKLNFLIPDDNVRAKILYDMQNIIDGKNLADPKLMGLTYVIYSHMLDAVMKKVIDEYQLVDFVLSYDSWNKLKCWLPSKLNTIEHKYPFFKSMNKGIMHNMEWIIAYAKRFDNMDMHDIDRGVEIFVKKIWEHSKIKLDLTGELRRCR